MNKRIVNADQHGTLLLGRQGENEVTEIVFTIPADLIGCEWLLNHRRAMDKEPYPIPLEKRDNALIWTVTSGDTDIPGRGYAELTCYGSNGEILKSQLYATTVIKALTSGGEVPDPVQPWYESLLKRIDSVDGVSPEEIAAAVESYLEEIPIEVPEVDLSGVVKSVNGVKPDEDGNVEVEAGSGGSSVEPAEDDIPMVFLSGDEFAKMTTDKNEVGMEMDYISKTKKFHSYIKIKFQGTSSLAYPKKNFTIKLYSDEAKDSKLKVNFKGWGEQSKFVMKANWIDLTHARNIVSARIWGDVVKTRPDYEQLSELLRTSPNQGAVDGFPIKVYINGVYQGRYTMNIPKDAYMANMDDALDNHCILCGEGYVSGCFRDASMGQWTDEVHNTVPDSISSRWVEAIDFVMNSEDEEFKSNIENYFFLDSLIDYFIYGMVSCGLDAFGKNQLYLTYDAVKWLASMYDMDSTWGLYWNGSSFVASDYTREEFQDFKDGEGNLLYIRLLNCFPSMIRKRYFQLRESALSVSNLISRFERFINVSPNDLVKEDYLSTTANGEYMNIPSKTTNNIQQLRKYIVDRYAYCDEYFGALRDPIPCTGITLDNTELSFTDTTQITLIATVEPSDTTDTIVWKSNNTSVAVVENGVVTPLANGNCTITATCGNYVGSCAVSISGLSESIPCTGITLDKSNLTINTLGSQETLVATAEPVDTTDVVIWSSSNEEVATVENGVVTVIAEGNAIITATCGNVSAECSLVVSLAVDYSAVDYSINPIKDINWHDDYSYSMSNGMEVTKKNEHCTDKFTVQNCAYSVVATGCTYLAIYVWDKQDNYVGCVEVSNNSNKFVGHSDYKFAVRAVSSEESIADSVSVMPIDNSQTPLGYKSIGYDNLTWSVDAGIVSDITDIVGGTTLSNLIDSASLPILYGNATIKQPKSCLGISNYLNKNYIRFNSSGMSTAEEMAHYFANNPTVLELNIRQK